MTLRADTGELVWMLRRWWNRVSARIQLRGCALGRRVETSGRVVAQGRRNITIGERSVFAGGLVPTRLIAASGAQLHVGERCLFNYGARFEAQQRITIGRGCLFGSAVVVCDRHGSRTAPITIEDGVWLAHGVQVRPGVRIGRDVVISAGTIVTSDVPPATLLAGNPPRALPLRLVNGGKEPACEH